MRYVRVTPLDRAALGMLPGPAQGHRLPDDALDAMARTIGRDSDASLCMRCAFIGAALALLALCVPGLIS